MSVITKSIIVRTPVERAYQVWEDFEDFPHFMEDIKSVLKTGERTSRWTMRGPLGKTLEWNARTTALEPNKRIAWNSINGGIKTSGSVTFDPLDVERTQITVMMQYIPPAGKLGTAGAHVFDNPDKRLEGDLRRFKEYAESPAKFSPPIEKEVEDYET